MDNFEEVLLNEDGDLIKLENFPQLDKEFEKVNESCNTQVNLNTDNIQFNSVISTGLQNLTKKSEDGTVVDTFFQKKFTDKVSFQKINLLEPYPVLGEFDVIFCRNVLIYQAVENKKDIIGRLTRHLVEGGHFIMGAAERVYGLSNEYDQIKEGKATVYRKKPMSAERSA